MELNEKETDSEENTSETLIQRSTINMVMRMSPRRPSSLK